MSGVLMHRRTTMWGDSRTVAICKPRREVWNAFSAVLSQGFSLLSFTQHLSDEISYSLEKTEQFLTDSILHRKRTSSLLNNLQKAPIFSHIQLSKYIMYGSVRCFVCCVFTINECMVVLCPGRSGLDKFLVIHLGNVVSKKGVRSKGSHCSMLLLRALVLPWKEIFSCCQIPRAC